MARESSEAWIGRATLQLEGERAVGGFIALPAREIGACRHADTLALIAAADRSERAALMQRLRSVAELQVPPEDDVYYLSRLGVLAAYRRQGRARKLLDAYLRAGQRAGFTRFALDVASDNASAISLYEDAGFRARGQRRAGGMSTTAMALDRS
jgi:ribosomal protein S18 acetylase RimI-like enzyme